MGNTKSTKASTASTPPPAYRAPLIPDMGHFGPTFCKSCWFESKGLVKCSDHYLCMNCLTLLLSASDRCPICKLPLPTKLELGVTPTAPPSEET
uniref:RING finger protein Z n=1 Tax=Arenavirus sp. TaxID=41118 RepID=A0A858HRM2_9VIRU|nr:Z protein [Arenavirus sp.]